MAQNRYYASTAKQASLAISVDGVLEQITLDLTTGFPGSYPYTLVLDPDTNKEELVKVTSAVGNVLNVSRGQDGTVALAHALGATVRHVVSGQDFNEFSAHTGSDAEPTKSGVHGVTSNIVGKDDVQILTNKTLVSPVVTGTGVIFEGATDDAYETTLAVVDPTADRTITFPNATGTVVLKDTSDVLTNKTLGSGTTFSGSLSMNSQKITDLANPTLLTDAANRYFVEEAISAATITGGTGLASVNPQSTTTGANYVGLSTQAARADHVHKTGLHASSHAAAGTDPLTLTAAQISDISNYLTTASAASTYLTQATAATTYIYRSELFNPFLLMGA